MRIFFIAATAVILALHSKASALDVLGGIEINPTAEEREFKGRTGKPRINDPSQAPAKKPKNKKTDSEKPAEGLNVSAREATDMPAEEVDYPPRPTRPDWDEPVRDGNDHDGVNDGLFRVLAPLSTAWSQLSKNQKEQLIVGSSAAVLSATLAAQIASKYGTAALQRGVVAAVQRRAIYLLGPIGALIASTGGAGASETLEYKLSVEGLNEILSSQERAQAILSTHTGHAKVLTQVLTKMCEQVCASN